MNNLATLRQLFQLSLNEVATHLAISADTLVAFEKETQLPTIAQWQQLAEYYSNQFHVQQTKATLIEPIHFRLSVDYLMNIGITINDLIAMKWYFENTRAELGQLTVALFSTDQDHQIERLTSDLAEVIDQFAGYLLLNHDGTLNQFIDERHQNHISDWRLLLYKNENSYVDITDIVSYFNDLPDFTHLT